MKNIYYLLLGALFATSHLKAEAPPYYEMLAHKITLDAAKEIFTHTHLEPIGLGGGMVDKIKTMS